MLSSRLKEREQWAPRTHLGLCHPHTTKFVSVARSATLENQRLLRRYIPAGSEEEEHLVFQVFEDMARWMHHDPSERAAQMITSFSEAWDKYSKPGLSQYNRWWTGQCQHAKQTYNEHPTRTNRRAFLHQCKLAKKAYFAKKIEEMVKSRKPWEGTSWIKQRALPKVPQIAVDGHVVNSLDQMFAQFHAQFAQTAAVPVGSEFVNELPQRPVRSWPPFSHLELREALSTCSTASSPGPSHFSWEYLKLFLKDDAFSSFFLTLANDIVSSGVWPLAFKLQN